MNGIEVITEMQNAMINQKRARETRVVVPVGMNCAYAESIRIVWFQEATGNHRELYKGTPPDTCGQWERVLLIGPKREDAGGS